MQESYVPPNAASMESNKNPNRGASGWSRTEQLAYYDVGMRRIVEPGAVRLFVGRSSQDTPLDAEIALVGPVVELIDRHDYVTGSSVE